MAEFMVSIVWDASPEGAESGLEAVEGAWVASSAGRLVTGVPVDAEGPSAAYEYAYLAARPLVGGARAIGFAAEPTSATPHFMLAAYGR